MDNDMTLRFRALSQNESFARAAAGAFVSQLDPTIETLCDIKTAVSEAVTNAIVHGYRNTPGGYVTLCVTLSEEAILIEVSDEGRGIADVAQARQPFFTTAPGEERSGMGFSVMEAFMDRVEVFSSPGDGTRVVLEKRLRRAEG